MYTLSSVVHILRLVFVVAYYYVESFFRTVWPKRPKDIRGQVVVVTGGASGIGRQLALQFSLHGARIAIWDINEDGAAETASLIRSANAGEARAYVCDVTRSDDVRRAASLVRRELGTVDILVNNAGIWYFRMLLDLSEEEIRKTFEVNALSHYWTMKEFLPEMVERDSGHIVTMSSMGAKGGFAYAADYCGTKWAVFGLAESVYDEMRIRGRQGIFFTTVCPMFVNTNLFRNTELKLHGQFTRAVLEPEDVAEVIVKDILSNQRYSYIPRMYGWTALQDFIPQKAKNAMRDFLQL